MTIVFISNYYNHHQSDFSENMHRETNGNYYFIATQPMEEERKNMGWNVSDFPSFVKLQYKDESSRTECQNLIDNADVVILGCASFTFLKNRLKRHKLTFKYLERPYKQEPEWYRLISHSLKCFWRYERFGNVYTLCASAFTASDLRRIHAFKNKCFKWGYFPAVKHYDNIEEVIDNKRKHSILWVSRFIEFKHPEVPIEVARRLKKEGYDFHLTMIGVGPLVEATTRKIKELGLDDNVEILGSMSPQEVRSHMDDSEIFMFTSDKNEGWGAVLNESMNSGCAVVGSHCIGSVPYLIKDGENGLIYKHGDMEDVYDKIKMLLTDDKQRKSMAKEAYKTLSDTWNAKTASKRLINLIQALGKKEATPYKDGPCSKAEIMFDNWK